MRNKVELVVFFLMLFIVGCSNTEEFEKLTREDPLEDTIQESGEDPIEDTVQESGENYLEGTEWKLHGFYDSSTDTIESAEPKDCAECYVIEFHKGDDWRGYSSTNEFSGKYKVTADSNKNLQLTDIIGTEINEVLDGEKYMEALMSVQSYQLADNKLKLFYGSQGNYLLFNKVK